MFYRALEKFSLNKIQTTCSEKVNTLNVIKWISNVLGESKMIYVLEKPVEP